MLQFCPTADQGQELGLTRKARLLKCTGQNPLHRECFMDAIGSGGIKLLRMKILLAIVPCFSLWRNRSKFLQDLK